jgi:hypothetical protein
MLTTKYYIRTYHDGLQTVGGGVWEVETTKAVRIDVSVSDLSICNLHPGLDIISSLKAQFPTSEFYELRLAPGEYYPRIARPNSSNPTEPLGRNPDPSKGFQYTRAKSTGQLHALIGQLEHICRVIHPEGKNLDSFGHEIRSMLILACTEAETHWKNVLEANGSEGESTKDYVKVANPLKLADYKVDFTFYPWFEPVQPFEKWGTTSATTKDIEWYFAYNQVKHNRDVNFSEATLRRAFHAVAACFVMLCAQHGWDFALRDEDADRAYLRLLEAPKWDPAEVYVPPYGRELKPKHYPFRL